MTKRTQKNSGEERVTAKSKPMKGILTCLPLLHQEARGKPDMEVNFLWARKLSSILERRDLLRTLTHQVTQSGMLIKLGLLKSGNLMNWWKIEQGDLFVNSHLVCSQSTRTNLSLMTMTWTLTPTQNQTCRYYPDHSCTGWMIECDRFKTNPQKMQHETATHLLWYGECFCLRRWKHLYSWERISQKIYIPSKIKEKIWHWNRSSTYLKKLITEQSDEIYGVNTINWRHSAWKYLSLVGGEEVVSLLHTQRSTYFQILYYAFGKVYENPLSITVWEDKLTWCKSSPQYRAFGHSWWWANGIRVEYFPRIHHIAALLQSPRVHVKNRAYNQTISMDGSSSCRCSTTSHGDPQAMNRNANWAPNSFLFVREDFHQDVGHSSNLDQKRSDILHTSIDHEENGTESLKWWWSGSEKADTSLPIHKSTTSRSAQKQRWWKIINTLLRRWGNDWNSNPSMFEQGDLFWLDNLSYCLCPQVRWWKHLHFRPMILRKKIYCKSTKNECKGSHNKKSCDQGLYWRRILDNSWSRTVLHDKAHWRVLTIYRISGIVVSTHCQEKQNLLTRKVGFEGTQKLGPYWKSQPVTYKVNMEWELNL